MRYSEGLETTQPPRITATPIKSSETTRWHMAVQNHPNVARNGMANTMQMGRGGAMDTSIEASNKTAMPGLYATARGLRMNAIRQGSQERRHPRIEQHSHRLGW